ncbi:MAG: hypothetical protein WB765_22105 [Acidimicrobiales bacterium]
MANTNLRSTRSSVESLAKAISLLESFVCSFEPARCSGEDAALLADRVRLG